jgi:8-oxo-dGTP pyrophosphatase MutT (NUDIX family)
MMVISNYQPHQISNTTFKPSAVLLTILPYSDSCKILMNERSPNLSKHPGQMSFPGGRFDPSLDTSLLDTALRETAEELGIPPHHHNIIGVLDDLPTITGYCIRPFITVYRGPFPIDYEINEEEVANIVEIPFSYLFSLPFFKETVHTRKGYPPFTSLSFDYTPSDSSSYNIWGASAHILAHFLKISFNKIVTSSSYTRPSADQIADYLKHLRPKE